MIRPGRIRFKFSRSSRLSRASEFSLVKASGKSWTGKHLVLAILTRETEAAAQNRDHCHQAAWKCGFPKPGPEKNQGNIQVESAPHSKRDSGLLRSLVSPRPSATFDELQRDWLRLVERASILAPGSHGSHPPDLT